jgi:hypothetical protein
MNKKLHSHFDLSQQIPTQRRQKSNQCNACGKFVGELFTGYSTDSWIRRGPLTCDRCLTKQLQPEK